MVGWLQANLIGMTRALGMRFSSPLWKQTCRSNTYMRPSCSVVAPRAHANDALNFSPFGTFGAEIS
jgi:hypothetical protein